MAHHTPGPWLVKDDDPHDHIFTEAQPHRRIANVYGGLSGSEENRANAALIAAAPDLLEALEFLWREVVSSGNGRANDFGWKRARQKTVAALVKATTLTSEAKLG